MKVYALLQQRCPYFRFTCDQIADSILGIKLDQIKSIITSSEHQFHNCTTLPQIVMLNDVHMHSASFKYWECALRVNQPKYYFQFPCVSGVSASVQTN